jgi:hypothetical protein
MEGTFEHGKNNRHRSTPPVGAAPGPPLAAAKLRLPAPGGPRVRRDPAGGASPALLAGDVEFFRREGVGDGFLVERVERRPQGQKRGDALHDLPEPAAFVVGQRFAAAAVGLPVSGVVEARKARAQARAFRNV